MGERSNVTAVLVVAVLLALSFSVIGQLGPARKRALAQRGLEGARYALTERAAHDASAPLLPQPGPLRFAPGTAAGDAQAVLGAIAGARPQARRLVDLVAGVVTVSVAPLPAGVAGRTQPTADGYEVTLALGQVSRSYGARGIARVTLHELGHVVDGALVPSDMEQKLDTAIPRGWGCDDGGKAGACADREERFAETFAKWATGDIGVDIYLGYRVPPPTPLESWGDPLAALGA